MDSINQSNNVARLVDAGCVDFALQSWEVSIQRPPDDRLVFGLDGILVVKTAEGKWKNVGAFCISPCRILR